jgi:hypothetical protein
MKGFEDIKSAEEAIQRFGRKPEARPEPTESPHETRLDVRVGKVPRSKFGAVKTTVDGITFDSKKEAGRYATLRMLEKGGLISHLELQPRYECIVNGVLVCVYRGDFKYTDELGTVVEDVKSEATKTPVYRLKAKLMVACHGVVIFET